MAAFAVASVPPEGREEEPVRAEDEVDDVAAHRREHGPSRLQINSDNIKITRTVSNAIKLQPDSFLCIGN